MKKEVLKRNNNQLILLSLRRKVGELGFPRLEKASLIPLKIISFKELLTVPEELLKVSHVHFFLDDYQFERFWNQPNRYLKLLKKARGVIGPDFSCYIDAPKALNIWNIYRNRLLDNFLQKNGVDVIPTLVWGNEETLTWCFDGIPKNSIVAVGTTGVDEYYFRFGFEVMMEKLKPHTVISYGQVPEELKEKYPGIICEYEDFCAKWRN